MTATAAQDNKRKEPDNFRVVAMCVAMVVGMGGLAYASVPLYELFCRVTGYGGTTQVAETIDGITPIERKMVIRFDANAPKGNGWSFRPETRNVEVRLGEKMMINYVTENPTDKPIVGMATFNVTPQIAGAYFNKIECFCFTETVVEPGGKLEMPVTFFVDPELDLEAELKSMKTITLSYTFYESDEEPQAERQAKVDTDSGETAGGKL